MVAHPAAVTDQLGIVNFLFSLAEVIIPQPLFSSDCFRATAYACNLKAHLPLPQMRWTDHFKSVIAFKADFFTPDAYCRNTVMGKF